MASAPRRPVSEAATPGVAAPLVSEPRRRSSLFRKYALVLWILVSGAVLTTGLVQAYFAFRQSTSDLVLLEREQAKGAAATIEGFVLEIQRQIAATAPPPGSAGDVSLAQRHESLLKLLRLVPAVSDVSYLNAAGREEIRLSRTALDVIGGGADRSGEEAFQKAKAAGTYYGPVFFRDESEPYMIVAVADNGPAPGVTIADVNLKLAWDVVSQIKIGQAGYAYVVDDHGRLIAHPDIGLVLQDTDLSALPQVRAALATPASSGSGADSAFAQDLQGRPVIAASAPIASLGWSVMVERPQSEALQPIYASLVRTGLLLLVGLCTSLLFGVLLARTMVRPVRALQAGVAQVASGDLDRQIEVRSGDELEDLADAFNHMTGDLRQLYATLEQRVAERTRLEVTARERIEQELRVARQIQLSLLPKDVPHLPGWRVAAYYQPARAVGGDLYDFHLLSDGRLGLVSGDVTDKGVPAALMMATTRAVLRAASDSLASPGEVLARTNDALCADMPPGMFVTCLYAILDPASGRLRYANAGQDAPYRRGADRAEELRATGMPLGLMPGMAYEERETALLPGETVLFYSDGIVEAHSSAREMFGFERLQALVAEHPGGPPLLDWLLEQLRSFTGPGWEQEDDVTLVVLERLR